MSYLITHTVHEPHREIKIKADATLDVIQQLLAVLHSNDISYCHWKSNEHLAASMTGDTDLDILFAAADRQRLLPLLEALNFKLFVPAWQKRYIDIEDFIALDTGSGKVVHLHAHFRLTMGEAYLKSYQLPVEEKILESRVFDETYGIYCIQPAWEMVLLYFREALKIRKRDLLKVYLKNKVTFSTHMMREYRWLQQRCTPDELVEVVARILPGNKAVADYVKGPFSRKPLMRLATVLRSEFKKERRYTAWEALWTRWYREVSLKIYRKSRVLFNRPMVARRINPRAGFVVAVVGADGSGKSTVIANLEATFKTKLDVCRVYLGRGDGRMSLSRKLLTGLKNILHPGKKNKTKTASLPAGTKKPGFFATAYKCIEALVVAFEKRGNLDRMRRAKAKGMLVICDRFPQNQLMGYNDGPLLHHLAKSKNPLFRMAASLERKCYAAAAENPPDLVIKLIAEAAVVEARKPGECSPEMLERKISGIRSLKFEGSRVVVVDAAQQLGQVLYEVKNLLWRSCP